MEAELLRGMIVDRDTRIANIKRKQEDLLAKEERLKEELSEAAESNSSQIITQQTERTSLYHEQQGVYHSLTNLHSHLQRQGDSLHEYSLYLQQNGDVSASDAQNVMRLQAQLCKAMHSVSIVDHQHEMLMAHNETLLKLQKEELAKQSEDKARIEQSVLNDLVMRDTEVRGVENKLKGELDSIYKEMDAIREQLDDSDSEDENNEGEPKEDEEEEEEEELDEEEKAAKEEMMKVLQERKQEIERLEKEIEEREELVEDLQMRAGEEQAPEDSRKTSITEKKEAAEEAAPPKKEVPPKTSKKEEKKEEPVDEMAARLQQVMAGASDDKVDEVDEMDLLKLAQSRLTGGDEGEDDDDDDVDDDDEEDSDEEKSEFDESFSEAVDDSGAGGKPSANAGEEEYDPTEKKEDPMVES